tara:strand:+ start:681 stop:929 length:249 start_codon:yes stop_codon:yes gene_type:complete
MDITDTTNAIQFIRPDALFTLRGDEIDWLDTEQDKPTAKEIADGLVAYKIAKEAKEAAELSKKAEILDRLGITAEEAKLILA